MLAAFFLSSLHHLNFSDSQILRFSNSPIVGFSISQNLSLSRSCFFEFCTLELPSLTLFRLSASRILTKRATFPRPLSRAAQPPPTFPTHLANLSSLPNQVSHQQKQTHQLATQATNQPIDQLAFPSLRACPTLPTVPTHHPKQTNQPTNHTTDPPTTTNLPTNQVTNQPTIL